MTRAILVWGTWGALTVAGLVFVAWYGRDCPYMDEWGMLPALTGDEELVSWLFRPHAEHRYPLPRLVYFGLFRLFGDLRAGMVATTLLLSASSAGLITLARQVRGRTSLADLFFSVSFLSGGHWENLLMSYQVAFSIPTALIVTVLILTMWRPRRGPTAPMEEDAASSAARVGLVGLAAILLTGCGNVGLCYAVGVAGWLGVSGWRCVCGGRFLGAVIAGAGVTAVAAVVGLMAANFPPGPETGYVAKPIDYVRFALRFAAVSFAPSANWLWPAEGGACMLAGGAAWFWVGRGCLKRSVGSLVGPAAVLLGATAMVAGMTWGRIWMGLDGAAHSRYAVVLLPGPVAAFLIAVVVGGRVGCVVPAALAVGALVAWPINSAIGIENGERLAGFADCLEVDLHDGVPSDLIADRYDWQLLVKFPGTPATLNQAARLRLKTFRGATPPRPTQSVPLPFEPNQFLITLPPSSGAFALRIRGEYTPKATSFADYRVRWRDGLAGPWQEQRFQVLKCIPFAVVIRVTDATERIELAPDPGATTYRLTSVELLTAPPVAGGFPGNAHQ